MSWLLLLSTWTVIIIRGWSQKIAVPDIQRKKSCCHFLHAELETWLENKDYLLHYGWKQLHFFNGSSSFRHVGVCIYYESEKAFAWTIIMNWAYDASQRLLKPLQFTHHCQLSSDQSNLCIYGPQLMNKSTIYITVCITVIMQDVLQLGL